MFVVRPVKTSDLDQIIALAELAEFGLTTLPRDPDLLAKRIRESAASFAAMEHAEPRGQSYLMVMEDTADHRVIGTAGILSKVGGFEPFYAYRIETSIHESVTLNIRKELRILHLVTEHNGPSEIGSLFLHPDYRKGGNGRTLSLSRFLFMAEQPRLFDRDVIAEMRGVIDGRGHSPFWDAVGKHFFDLEFPKADYLSIVNKEFIGDLMPNHPIFIALLPQEAQDVIGEVHENTRPARALLESEGFRFNQMIDIFEAGPILESPRTMIRAARESRIANVVDIPETIEGGERRLICNRNNDFRCCQSNLEFRDGGVALDAETAAALEVETGYTVRFVTPKAKTGA